MNALIAAAETALASIRAGVLCYKTIAQAIQSQGLSSPEVKERLAALERDAKSALAELPGIHAAQLKEIDR